MNISKNFQNGDPKYKGLYEWQVDNNVSDDDPMYPLIAMVFAVVLALPESAAKLREAQAETLAAIKTEREQLEKSKASKTQNRFVAAIIGGFVGAASFVLMKLVFHFFIYK